jgi:hypothetical protein
LVDSRSGKAFGRGESIEVKKQQLTNLDKFWNVAVWDFKMAILTSYLEDNGLIGKRGTLKNIAAKAKYVYEGKEYPIGQWVKDFRSGKGFGLTKDQEIRKQQLFDMDKDWDKLVRCKKQVDSTTETNDLINKV